MSEEETIVSATANYEARVKFYMDRGMDRAKAVREVAVNDPEINLAFVAAHNLRHNGEEPGGWLRRRHGLRG